MLRLLSAGLLAATAHAGAGTAPFVGGYALLNGPEGLTKLQLLSDNAATLPITRLFLGFLSPTMVYVKGSANLSQVGLSLSAAPDGGFAVLKAAISKLSRAGIDVMLSIGGWDFNCFPYLYTRYSVAGYGTSTPNYWKIQQYCAGDVNNAAASNEYCYTCEPQSANETLNDFNMFPEPAYSPTWAAAVAYVTAAAGGDHPPKWDTTLINGQQWTDPLTGITVTVPGDGTFNALRRDPYADVVTLCIELDAAGVDLDYEEDYHADYVRGGGAGGLLACLLSYRPFFACLTAPFCPSRLNAPTLPLSPTLPFLLSEQVRPRRRPLDAAADGVQVFGYPQGPAAQHCRAGAQASAFHCCRGCWRVARQLVGRKFEGPRVLLGAVVP